MSFNLKDGLCIYYSSGSGLIVGGGPGMSSQLYREFLNPLLGNNKLATWDYRGTGGSEVRSEMSAEKDFQDLCAVVNTVSPCKPVTLIAHSYGCALALRWATSQPERVEKLVLIGGAISFGPVLEKIILRKFQNMQFLEFSKLLGLTLLSVVFGDRPQWTKAFVELESKNQLFNADEETRLRLAQIIEISVRAMALTFDFAKWDLLAEVKSLRVPTLVIAGKEDIIVPESFTRQLAEAIPGSRYECLPACGHWPFLERPGEFGQAVNRFLD